MEDVYNPMIHRINHAIRSRALYPDKPVPAIPSDLLRYASPPGGLVSEVRREIDRLVEAAEVKKVPPKTKSRRFREVAKPLSGLDVDALLGQSRPSQTQTQTQHHHHHREQQDEQGEHHRQHQPAGDSPQHRSAPRPAVISRDNAIPEFKRALVAAEQTAEVDDAAGQMGAVIRSLISDSFGDALYDRALENLGAMRSCLVEAEEPDGYNRFARDLKRRLLSGELGGDRRDFWYRLRKGRLGLIDSAQSDRSVVTAEDSDKFYKSSR